MSFSLRKYFVLLLLLCISFTGCKVANKVTKDSIVDNEINEKNPMKITENASDEVEKDITNPEDSIETILTSNGKTNIAIEGKEHENGIQYPSGKLIEIEYSLPGYKKVPLKQEHYQACVDGILAGLANAEPWNMKETYTPLTGAGLHITYQESEQRHQFSLYNHLDGKRILLTSNPFHIMEGPAVIASEELSQLIEEQSGWNPFDIQEVLDTDRMLIKIESGLYVSDQVITIEGEELSELLQLLVNSAQVDDDSECGFHILIIMQKDGVDRYRGYLAADSCPRLNLETQYFKVAPEFHKQIHEMLGLDVNE